jgi:hypothetical protein
VFWKHIERCGDQGFGRMNRRRLDLSENVEIGNEVVLGSVVEGLDSVVVLGSDVAI